MGSYLNYFFRVTKAESLAWFVRVRLMIEVQLSRSSIAGGSVAQKADNLISWLLLGGSSVALAKEVWGDVLDYVDGGFTGHFLHAIEQKTGVRPVSLDEQGMKAWLDAVICKTIRERLDVEVTTLNTQAGVTGLLNSLTSEVLLELKADEAAKYTLLNFDQSAALRRQIASTYLKAHPPGRKGFFMSGAVTVLPVDRADMLNTLRQQRWRKKHKPYYENWLVDPTTDALVVQLRNELDGVK